MELWNMKTDKIWNSEKLEIIHFFSFAAVGWELCNTIRTFPFFVFAASRYTLSSDLRLKAWIKYIATHVQGSSSTTNKQLCVLSICWMLDDKKVNAEHIFNIKIHKNAALPISFQEWPIFIRYKKMKMKKFGTQIELVVYYLRIQFYELIQKWLTHMVLVPSFITLSRLFEWKEFSHSIWAKNIAKDYYN